MRYVVVKCYSVTECGSEFWSASVHRYAVEMIRCLPLLLLAACAVNPAGDRNPGSPGAGGDGSGDGPVATGGDAGPESPEGTEGPQGAAGQDGHDGTDGVDGAAGAAGDPGAQGDPGTPCWEDLGDQDGSGAEDTWDCVWAAICPGPFEEVPDADGDGEVDLDDCRELLRGADGSAGPAGQDGQDGEAGRDGEDGEDGEDGQGGQGGNGDLGPAGDVDGDGIVNAEDNCVFAPNDGQSDIDLDGLGDPCDPDRDGDGFANDDDCWPDDPERFPGAGEDTVCDGLDDDCDGDIDEDFVPAPCDTGDLGVCAAGTLECFNGVQACVADAQPVAEECNGLDDDCDGEADEELDCGPPRCADHPDWQPVACQTGEWVWSSDRAQAQDLATANRLHVLYTNFQQDGMCSLDGTGWVSRVRFNMRGCNQRWYHIGGRYTGNCGGHDGEIVRILALGPTDCWDYQGLDVP